MAYEQEHPLINGASNNTAASTPDTLGGGWIFASLSSSTDVDYFKVSTVSAALIRLDLSNLLVTDTAYWNLSLLNSSGDYVTSVSSSVNGVPLVEGANTGTTLAVNGLTSAVPVGSRFTFSTNAADTTIYTVTSATTPNSGTSTLTLDQAVPSGLVANTALSFDPAQSLVKGVNGASASLTGQVSAAGTYFVKVSAASWSDAEYSVRATVLPTVESGGDNNSKDVAIASATTDQNRPVENAWMTGNLSDANDTDFWVFSTASMTGDIKIDFAAASGDNNSPEWEIKLTRWSGNQPLTSLQGVPLSATAGASKTFTIESAKYGTADTYVIEVVKASGVTVDTGAYQLRLSGTAPDLNDTPIITIDSVTSTLPYLRVLTGVNRSVKAAASDLDADVQASKVALSSLFSVSDADTGQAITSYNVALSKTSGDVLGSSITFVRSASSTTVGLSQTISLTAAEMATAYLLPGTGTGDLSLALQAFDSSGALDNSGASSVMLQTLRVVSSAVGVSVATDGTLSLEEGNSSSTETLSLSLGTAPTQNVKVYLEQDNNNRFDFGASVLTFSPTDFSTPQTVLVTARDNHFTEGLHSGQISFRVVSADSQYDGYNITPLAVTIVDPANHPPTGGISFTGTVVEDQVLMSATDLLVDADTLGTLVYQWQRSTNNGTNWADINAATSSSYKLGDADVGNAVRLVVSYVDGHGSTETVYSEKSSAVINVNDAPTLTAFASTVGTVAEDTQATITLTDLAAQGNEADIDGTVTGFVVKAVSTGTLKIGASEGAATAWAATTNDLVDATHIAYWTGALNANGTLNAFTAVARDNNAAESATAIQATMNVTAVNDAPTLTAFTSTIGTVAEDTLATISLADLVAKGDEVDVDGTVTGFVVKAVSSGTLKIGASEGAATAWAASTNDLVDATHIAYWTGALNANGTLNAFTVVAKDNSGVESSATVQATMSVTAGNDAPTAANKTLTTNEDTQLVLTATDFGFGDVDAGAALASVKITTLQSAGALKYNGAAVTLNQVITRADIDASKLTFDAVGNANGAAYATFGFTVNDGTADSAVTNAITVNVTAVNDAPTLTAFASTIGTVAEDTQATTTFADLVAKGDEVDVDGTVTGFVVKAVSSGTLKIGASEGAATAWAATTNDLVDATHIAYWSGAQNANGTLNAFTAVARDNSGAESTTAIQATMNVTAVNDAPTGAVSIGGTATQGVTLTASNDLADVDGIPTSGIGAISYQWLAGGSTISGANTGTYVLTSAEVGKTVTVVASYTDNDGHAESVTSAATSSVTAIVGKTVDVVVNTWKTAAPIEGVSINGSSYSGTSSASGATSFSSVTEANLNLTASRTVPGTETTATSAAVNLQDAIAILKMIVGLPVNGANQPLSPYQSLAADFDGNGTVGLTDAIGVLKHVVGLSAPEPTWHFVNAADTALSGINPLNPGSPPGISVDLSGISPVQVGLVGYLTGDVDGSFIK
jgi:hypothetical protein